jgi:hypothetical protein
MLVLSIVHGLQTRQVDFVNAFCQTTLETPVYGCLPLGFEDITEGQDSVLRLEKSLYGMTSSPKIFFDFLKDNMKGIQC